MATTRQPVQFLQHERSGENGERRHGGSDPPLLQSSDTPFQVICIVKPEKTCDAIGIPRRKERGCDTSEVGEYRYCACEDEGDGSGREA